MTPNYQIQGAIPFGAGGNPLAGAAGGVNGLAQQYGQSYDSALKMNEQLYGNILTGYQQTLGNQTAAQGQIQQGYGNLQNQVLGGIQGVGAAQSQAINDVYAQQSGATAQSAISRGLGNTTVADSLQRGVQLDRNKAQVALANQIAQLNAGYQSNLGMAGLNQQNQANMQNTAESNQQLGWMNSVTAAYPHAQDYYGLYQQQGAWQQAQADRDLAANLAQQGRATVPPVRAGAPVPNRSMDTAGANGGGAMVSPVSGGGGGFMDPGVMNSAYATNNPSTQNLGDTVAPADYGDFQWYGDTGTPTTDAQVGDFWYGGGADAAASGWDDSGSWY